MEKIYQTLLCGIKRDTGLYAINAFRGYHGGMENLELHRVEAESKAAAKALLATWALENLNAFSETSFNRVIAKKALASMNYDNNFGFLAYQIYTSKYLNETNEKIRKESTIGGQAKEYCRHRFKKK